MFEIDKRSNDEKRRENPVRNRRLPRKALPNRQEKQRSDQFHREITKGDFRAAIRTTPTQQNPADQRQILMPGNRLFAGRTKRAPWLVNGKSGRPAIDADVQKRPDRRAENKGKCTEERLVNRMLHARLLGDRPGAAALH